MPLILRYSKLRAESRIQAFRTANILFKFIQPFLDSIEGALTKDLLVRDEDVQVLHGFDSAEHAQNYWKSELFTNDVFVGLKPLWDAEPDVKIYTVA